MTDTTAARRRGIRTLAAVAATLAIAVLTLGPRTLVAPARGAFMTAMDAATAPLLLWIAYADAERILNTIMFVPLGASIALLLARRLWPLAIGLAFALSAGVEYAQSAIPGRVSDADDVLWNTTGGAIGVIVVTGIRLMIVVWQRLRQRGRVTRT